MFIYIIVAQYNKFQQKASITINNNHKDFTYLDNYSYTQNIVPTMKSVFRIYAKTSRGNDNHLLKQLHQLNLQPQYDQHMNSFYFNSTWSTLFDISFRSLTVQQMYIQIGQKFRMIDQQQIAAELQRLPFKNYIPVQRGLIESTTLKILIRESVHMPSQNVLTSLVTNNFGREITKKQYYQEIDDKGEGRRLLGQVRNQRMLVGNQERGLLEGKRQRRNHLSYFDIKDAVERKWWQEDEQRAGDRSNDIIKLQKQLEQAQAKQKKLLLENNQLQASHNQQLSSLPSSHNLTLSPLIQQSQHHLRQLKTQLNQLKQFSQQTFLSQQLAYHPHLIFYIRKNKGRFLLKINKDNLYKHGWKSQVNWGPIRESIAASILHQAKVLDDREVGSKKGKDSAETGKDGQTSMNQQRKTIKLWDPMCGSGTFGLVAATMLQQVPVRSDIEKLFQWVHWPVFKKQFLTEYYKQKQLQQKQSNIDYQLILSDKDRQTINYSIDNFRLLLSGLEAKRKYNQQQSQQKQLKTKTAQKLFPSSTPTSQILQLVQNKIGFACGDFQSVIQLLKNNPKSSTHQPTKLNIITNLPYLHGRSESKHPLNQLASIYTRFSQMINQNYQLIDNVFVIIDKNINDRRHFLNVSQEKWTLIGEYTSGGMQVGLYAWSGNTIKSKFDQTSDNAVVAYEKIKGEVSSEDRQLILKREKNIERALIEYRKKLSEIDRTYYNLPRHLVRNAKGWRRVMQKRRKRHLQSAYELFARKRDKLIALKQYARMKLQIKMLKRGTVWKSKNLRFFNHSDNKLQQYSQQIKQIFQKKIQQALKKQQASQLRRKLKTGDKIEVAKIRNKWNSDERKMVKQIKYSKGSQTAGRRMSARKENGKTGVGYRRK